MTLEAQEFVKHGKEHLSVEMVVVEDDLVCPSCGVTVDSTLMLLPAEATCNGWMIKKKV
jgi:hypothetical protein